MLGILNSPCTITVAKETGQTGKTVVWENIVNMWSRLSAPSKANAVWLINQDVEPQLFNLGIVIGTGGSPAFMPAGAWSGTPFNSIFGRPVIPVEYCETLGTKGDIILADFSQYLLCEKGGLKTDYSMHVQFLTDQGVFRFVMRNDGQPIWPSALTPYKGTATVSPFVTLDVRA
jgi:HK97 family phage major capsid protein